ncbi:LysR family transcriptional regulator [Oceanibacterium hippocampi]|uniref:HTH-type transcriptional regulator DmlR n=1 Tax=Oceanibacterium hippocampi TaxID=745714 RepID=A0A1Y5U1B0_9PROT|nr:LysR family transcriptional regulator [Oceanibacterium hippocampi]SLN74310.1 HTH-type transcriptional regulator DmlR [Oceanibacterium hippocampi]
MDWDKLRIFHAVAEAGSFTRAGDILHLSQSAVSRQISSLEESLATKLFHRHARGLILTEQGELLFRTAHDVFAKLATVEGQLKDAKEKPSGELKVTTTVGLGSSWLTPRIREFLELYPDITVNLILADRELDLSMREADVAIRLRQPVQADLIQRRLLTVHYRIYGSPDYLKRYGMPMTPDEIGGHRLIVYGEEAPSVISDVNWLLDVGTDRPGARRPVLKVNNIYGLLLAVESGLGIGALPDYIVHGNSNLVQVLPDVPAPSFDAFFVYPEELRNSKRVTIFRDFLIRKVSEWRF